MQILKAGYEIYPIVTSYKVLNRIEEIARVCYKSEDKIATGSAQKMVRALVNNKHYAMLEHGSIIMGTDERGYEDFLRLLSNVRDFEGEIPYIRYTPKAYSGRYIISGNMRAWLELMDLCKQYQIKVSHSLLNVLKQDEYSPIFNNVSVWEKLEGTFYRIEPTQLINSEQYIHLDVSVKFIVDRGVSHEIVRHRKASFAQESTRYCNYNKTGVAYIKPCFIEENTVEMDNWVDECMANEALYTAQIEAGKTPQEARGSLNHHVKTEVVMTATPKVWVHFFELRALGTTGKPHPQIQEVALPLLEEFKDRVPVIFDALEVK